MAKSQSTYIFLGLFRIRDMDQWDQDFVDEEVEGFFEFKKGGQVELHFGYVHGVIDYRLATSGGKTCVEFSWDGNDEMDSARGRGAGEDSTDVS